MTTPDAATEALAEAERDLADVLRLEEHFNHQTWPGMARFIIKELEARGYVIRKARKSG